MKCQIGVMVAKFSLPVKDPPTNSRLMYVYKTLLQMKDQIHTVKNSLKAFLTASLQNTFKPFLYQ